MGTDFKKYQYVEHIERTNETTITLVGTGGSKPTTTLTFNTPSECLKRFIELRKEYETAWHFSAPMRYRNGARW